LHSVAIRNIVFMEEADQQIDMESAEPEKIEIEEHECFEVVSSNAIAHPQAVVVEHHNTVAACLAMVHIGVSPASLASSTDDHSVTIH